MPKRGSKAQLIHLLAREESANWNFYYGGRYEPPAAFYESYAHYQVDTLKEIVAEAGLQPDSPGRPRKRYSHYAVLSAKVDEMKARRKKLSERSACERVVQAARHLQRCAAHVSLPPTTTQLTFRIMVPLFLRGPIALSGITLLIALECS